MLNPTPQEVGKHYDLYDREHEKPISAARYNRYEPCLLPCSSSPISR
jgi:hypothetical protein